MVFPVFRKYPNNRSFFKVLSPGHFEEVKITGKKAELFVYEAKILPDRIFIQDMLVMEGGFWIASSAEEFEEVFKQCSPHAPG